VDRATALRGMWAARPDPGVMAAYEINFFGRRLYFVNGFAANDPESTEKIWRIALDMFPDVERRVALFNCRADRPDRSKSLGEACVKWPPAEHYVLMGSGTYIFARAATRAGLDSRKLFFAEDYAANEIFETVISLVGRSALVMGMGNIGGLGLDVIQHFRNRAVVEGAA
jgi:poly-gamma-glutamate synthase PgsB/CapB